MFPLLGQAHNFKVENVRAVCADLLYQPATDSRALGSSLRGTARDGTCLNHLCQMVSLLVLLLRLRDSSATF